MYWSIVSILTSAQSLMGSVPEVKESVPVSIKPTIIENASVDDGEQPRVLQPTESAPVLQISQSSSMKIPKNKRTLKAKKGSGRRHSREKLDRKSSGEDSYSGSPDKADSRVFQAYSDPIRRRPSLSASDGVLPLNASTSEPRLRRSRAESAEGRNKVKPIELKCSHDIEMTPKSPRRFIQISPRHQSSTTPSTTSTSTRTSPSLSPPEVTRSTRNSNPAERLDIVVRRKSLNEKQRAFSGKEKEKRKSDGIRKRRSTSASALLSSSSSKSERSDETKNLESLVEVTGSQSCSPPKLRRKRSFTDTIGAAKTKFFFHRRRSSSSSSEIFGDSWDSPIVTSSSSESAVGSEDEVTPLIFSAGIWATPSESKIAYPGPSSRFIFSLLQLLGPSAIEPVLFAHGIEADQELIDCIASSEETVYLDPEIAIPIIIETAFLYPMTNTVIETYLGIYFGPNELLRALILILGKDVKRHLNSDHPPLTELYDLNNPLAPIHMRALLPEYVGERTPLASIFYKCYKRWLPRAFRDRVNRYKGNLERALYAGKTDKDTQSRWTLSRAYQ